MVNKFHSLFIISLFFITMLILSSCSISELWEGYRDEEGISAVLYQIIHIEDAGFPIYESPSAESRILRTARHLESYSTGPKENGFVKVRMESDRLIGWVHSENIDWMSPEKASARSRSVVSAWNYYWNQFSLRIIVVDILIGVMTTGILLLLFGSYWGGQIDSIKELTSLGITTLIVYLAHRTQLNLLTDGYAYQVEFGSMLAAGYIAIFPALLSAGIGDLVFYPHRIETMVTLLIVIAAHFVLWLGASATAGTIFDTWKMNLPLIMKLCENPCISG